MSALCWYVYFVVAHVIFSVLSKLTSNDSCGAGKCWYDYISLYLNQIADIKH